MRSLLPLLMLLTPMLSVQARAEYQVLDKVVAIVDQGVVLQSEVDDTIADVRRNAAEANQALPPGDVLRAQVLEQLIMKQVQLQIAQRMGAKVSDAQLDQTLQGIAADEQLTLEQLRAKVEQDGRNWEQFREQIREEIQLGDVRRASVQRRVSVTPQEVDAVVRQLQNQEQADLEYHVGHIRIELPQDASAETIAETRKRTEEVLEQLRKGADFRATAIAVSSDPKALQGGDWGWMNINEMPTLFAEALANAENGALIGPLRSGSGFHIVKIFDIRGAKAVEVTEYRVRHILIKPSPIVSDERARQVLTEAAAEIRADNSKFGPLARKLSEDTGSAANNGELSWATADTYVPEFQKAIETTPIGVVTAPFRTQFGWHILQVEDKRIRDVAESHLKDRAYRLLFNRKFIEQQALWLQEIRSQAYIQVVEDKSGGNS